MPNQAEWDYKKTVQSIIQMSQNSAPKLKDFPESLTFHPEKRPIRYTIGAAIDEVWQRTEADPDHHEHGRGFIIPYLRPNILLPKQITRGLPNEVTIDVPLARNPFNHWQTDKLALKAHSHGKLDVPLSMRDFFSVLLAPGWAAGSTAGTVILTKTLQMAAFRTDDTPIFDLDTAELQVGKMEEELDQILYDGTLLTVKEQTQIIMKNVLEKCRVLAVALFANLREDPILRRVRF